MFVLLMSNQCLTATVSSNLCCATLKWAWPVLSYADGPDTTAPPSHPDDAGGLQHHPSPLHACHLAPRQVGAVGALHGLVHLLRAAGKHLAQDSACRSESDGLQSGSTQNSSVITVQVDESIDTSKKEKMSYLVWRACFFLPCFINRRFHQKFNYYFKDYYHISLTNVTGKRFKIFPLTFT